MKVTVAFCRSLSASMVVMLALIAATVCVLMLGGYTAWPVIILYWATLTLKNLVDYIAVMRERSEKE